MKQVLQGQPRAFLHENVPSFPVGELERIVGGEKKIAAISKQDFGTIAKHQSFFVLARYGQFGQAVTTSWNLCSWIRQIVGFLSSANGSILWQFTDLAFGTRAMSKYNALCIIRQ